MMQGLLVGHKVAEVMGDTCTRVPENISLQELVDQQVLAHGRRCFLVDRGNRIVGLLTLHNIKEIPRGTWSTHTAGEAMIPLEKLGGIAPDAELWTALEKMGANGINEIPVVRGDSVIGMLSTTDIVNYLKTLQQVQG
jgi:CBS domain-containing protein